MASTPGKGKRHLKISLSDDIRGIEKRAKKEGLSDRRVRQQIQEARNTPHYVSPAKALFPYSGRHPKPRIPPTPSA